MIIDNEIVSPKTIMEIGKFAILWNYFEDEYFNNECNPSKIKQIVPYLSINNDKQKHLADVLNNRRNIYGQDIPNYVDMSLHPNGARHGQLEDSWYMEEFLKQRGEHMDCGCILTIARIRNNMMHGLKGIGELDGQIELFKAVNEVLRTIKRK